MISDNLRTVREKIDRACGKTGRNPDEVTLIAVSKTKPLSDLREAYAAGIRNFGENKVQELTEKADKLPGDIRWHMIGHLQRNKVKYIVGRVWLIHSVDSLRLAEEISREAQRQETEVNVLVEVNVSGEDSKFGVACEETEALVRRISVLPAIHVKGLMTVAPVSEEPGQNRSCFVKLRELAVDIGSKNIDNVTMTFLSMGMTGDFEAAVEEGATLTRVGTGIFGERNYVSPTGPL